MKETMNTQTALYPIREVSRLTGVNAITLRAWERRYELFEPVRTESGHRLFTQNHIDRINAAVKLTEQGIPISQVKRVLGEQTTAVANTENRQNYDYASELFNAIQSFDLERVERELNAVFSELDEATLNLILRQVSLKIECLSLQERAFWESVVLPKLYVRFGNTIRKPSYAYNKRVWLQNGQKSHSDVFLLLVGLHLSSQGWYPFLQVRGQYEPQSLFDSIQKFKCQAIAVVDDTGAMDEMFWKKWVKAYPSLDFFYFVNQPEVDGLSALLSAHYYSLDAPFN